MDKETIIKLKWVLKKELQNLSMKNRDIILKEVALLVERRISFFTNYEAIEIMPSDVKKLEAAKPLYLNRLE